MDNNKEWTMDVFTANLRHYMDLHKRSQKEVAEAVGVSAPTFHDWLKGNKMPRMKNVQKLADYFGIALSDLIEEKPKSEQRKLPPNIITPAAHPIPVLGTICAGDGIVANEHFVGQFFIDSSVHADYALKVKGDSMIDAEIYDGDMAFIKKEFDFRPGKVYAVVHGVDSEASLKKVFEQGDKFILQPCNAAFSPIVVDISECYVVGELVGVYHEVKTE